MSGEGGEGPREGGPRGAGAGGKVAEAKPDRPSEPFGTWPHDGASRTPAPDIGRELHTAALPHASAIVPSANITRLVPNGPRVSPPVSPLTQPRWRIGSAASGEFKSLLVGASLKIYGMGNVQDNNFGSEAASEIELGVEGCFNSGLDFQLGLYSQAGAAITNTPAAKEILSIDSKDLQVKFGVPGVSVSASWDQPGGDPEIWVDLGGEGIVAGAAQPVCMKIALSKTTISRAFDALAVEIASQFSKEFGYPLQP